MSRPGLRRLPQPDLDAVESDPDLVAMIRGEIERDGPITFARFMERALYEPGHGYYRSAERRPGRGGDFLTAPEAHPLFGRALARFAAGVWAALGSPDRFTIRESGAGGGALAESLLARLAAAHPALAAAVRYRAEEIEPRRVEDLRGRLAAAGLDGRFEDDDGAPIVGLAIANEVLDALPTHRVVMRGGRLREVLVDTRDGGFVDVEADPATPDLSRRLEDEGIRLAEGQRAEVCLELEAWVARAAAGLERGVLLLVDYGDPAERLYDAGRRPAGTLLAYLRHRAHDDVFRAIGRQDLTAHVDVTAVEAAATAAGLTHLGTTTQGRFLAALGAGELLVELQGATAASLAAYLEARSALVRMIDPAAMGAFKVMVFGRGLLPKRRCPASRIPPEPHRTSPVLTGIRQTPYRRVHRRSATVAPPASDIVVADPVVRRGADRELARALGAVRSPTFPVPPSPRRRSPGRTPRRAGATCSPVRMRARGDPRVPPCRPPWSPSQATAAQARISPRLLGVNVG